MISIRTVLSLWNLAAMALLAATPPGTAAPARHWAFEAPARPPLPQVHTAERLRNGVDHFVMARREQENLPPSPEADKAQLLRRLSLDLIGLPPSLEELDLFLADESGTAYEQAVERLLGSPHYGERWGRLWLDAARYADSDGYEKDKSRAVWFYRDWVINALNRDMPYDQFVIEQIAGDLLPHPTQDQRVATGFLRNSMINEEGGIDPEQFRMDAMYDRMDCIGKSILGLTIQCAQCHDHKYDPMSQREYYRMFSFLNNSHEAQQTVYTPDQQTRIARLQRSMNDLEQHLRDTTPDWETRMDQWEHRVSTNLPVWTVVRSVQVSEPDTRFSEQPDGSLLGLGYAPTQFTFSFRGTNALPIIRAVRLELIPDPNLPAGGPGRSFKGTGALTEFSVEAADVRDPDQKTTAKILQASADFANSERDLEPNFDDRSGRKRITGSIEFAIDGKDETAWGIDAGPGLRNQARKSVFVTTTNIAFPGGTVLTFHLKNNHGGWNSDDHQNNNLGRFRLSVSSSENAVADPLPATVREILGVPTNQRTAAQIQALFSYWRTTVPDFQDTNDKITALWRQWPEGSTALTLMARDTPRQTHVLTRGDWLHPEDSVTPGTPAFLPPLPADAPETRLTFAQWLMDRRNPTPARVMVNRIWQSYFGIGIVDTPEDFGTQSQAPSHPQLLDWLACELMDHRWSLKHIHRLITLSTTYRQSSRMTPELRERDPYNRMLARSSRIRVDAELVRDIALRAGGLLNPEVGGPSVYSPAPQFLFKPPVSFAPFSWNEETGSDRYRRSLYTFRRRSTPFPMLQTFDAPNGDSSCVRRLQSNTPLQALMTLNETVSMECSRALSLLTIREGGATEPERIRYAFRRTLGREPETAETAELQALLERAKTHIRDGWVSAVELASGDTEPLSTLPPGITPTELAAYTVVSRALLNLDETITRE